MRSRRRLLAQQLKAPVVDLLALPRGLGQEELQPLHPGIPAPATGSAPARQVIVLFRSRGASSPVRYSRNPRRWARLKKRSSNRAAYSSNGPGAGGHGRRAVIFSPQQSS
ncbi:hypothetical protein [Streptomyces ipomoeae]|uniref:hypothetical protein n=1 Tax=Streptomyces ipomoeae TaxID=103232 RepID=UPI0015F007FB|nr:hypothetical protein [Streptomyces ipomoeae]MDX2939633.1 hypothetical protein [Streptomyces ipomoeae]